MILLIFTEWAIATDFGFEAGTFLENNTNINLVSDSPVEETVSRSYAAVRIIELGPVLESRIDARVTRNAYRQDIYPVGTVKTLDALNTLFFIPKRLSFNIDDHLAYVPIDASALLLPDNQQQINLFSIGPSLIIDIGPVDYIEALYNKQKYYEQVTIYDNKRDLASARLVHKFERNNELGVNYQYQNTNFEDESVQDHKRSELFFSYLYRSLTDRYSLEAGKTSVKFKEGVNVNGNKFRLNLQRQLNRGDSLQLSYRNELSDVANELSFTQLISSTRPIVVSSVPLSNTGDVFRINTATLDYLSRSYPAQLHMGYTVEKVDYYHTPNDQEDNRFSMDYTFPVLERMSLTALYTYTDRNIPDLSRQYHISNARLTVNYSISRDLFLSGYIGYEKNDSSDPLYDYRNNLYGIGIVYQTEKMRSIHLDREAMPGGIQ